MRNIGHRLSGVEASLEERIRDIARSEAIGVLARPEYVHQRNVEAVVGLPPRDYLRAAHAGHFPSTKERRLIIARTVDVLAYFELRLRTTAAPVANDSDSEALTLARVGARRVSR